ncbi:hypothetical protein DFS34DRAFT_591021 [Phlyctochytrium arcticum]|nr:hypothetical protein DFS34DRAFT_591387 [Phlyctochytrium arcticum]KAI9103492.1 hypothetical protein DFS34DRAFT_591021 [Phlyctochytrium arcticum]
MNIPEITIKTVDGFEVYPDRGKIKNLQAGGANKTGEYIGSVNSRGIDNLEVVTQQQSLQWRDKNQNNTSGYKGVTWGKRDKKWRANIQFQGKQCCLGYFETKEEAARAYLEKAKELNEKYGMMYKLYEIE